MLGRLFRRARTLVQRDRMERELDQELRFHIEMEIEKNISRGMSPADARMLALRAFGGVEKYKDECRDARGISIFETLWQDIRFGSRMLIKNPGFTLVAVLVLALGIGANTAIFSVVYGVLLRPLPYTDGSRLVVLHQQAPLANVDDMGFSVKEINDYQEQNQSLEDLVEYHSMSFLLLGRGEPDRVQTGVVSTNFFDVLGVKPLLGRTFLPSDNEHGAPAVLVLSYEYWQRSFHGDESIVGESFKMNDRPHLVIGVLPSVPQYPEENDVYMPTSACPTRSSDRMIANRRGRMMQAFARLKPGVSVEAARTDVSTIAGRLQKEYPEFYPENIGFGATMAPLREELTKQARPTLLILLATVSMVLLLACANVANLTLARLMGREKEMAVRTALGAGRGRLIRQLLTESTMLSLAGGALGLFFAAWGLDLLVAFVARFTTRAAEIHIDGSVLLFTLIVSIGTGLLFGLVPAFTSEQKLTSALKEGGGRSTFSRSRQRLRSLLIVFQVAISFMLLIGAGLMVRSLVKLQHVDPGFKPEKVLSLRVNANWSKYTEDDQYRNYYRRLLDKIESRPDVLSAAVSSSSPLSKAALTYGPYNRDFQIQNVPLAEGELAPKCDYQTVSPKFFDTLGIPLIEGRLLTASDNAESVDVAVINQSMANHVWGSESPIDRRISLDKGEHWIQIVGIVGDVKRYGLDSKTTDEIYRPLEQNPNGGRLLIRTIADPTSLAREIRQAIHEIDSETAVSDIVTLEQARSESLGSPRLTAILLGLFAALALIITATGLAGVMALSVRQRSHEIGIRMALGASQGKVLWMMLRQGMGLVVTGLALGLTGSLALAHLMAGLLFGIEPTDSLTYFAVSLVLVLAATTACLVPARRATSIDPMVALRSE